LSLWRFRNSVAYVGAGLCRIAIASDQYLQMAQMEVFQPVCNYAIFFS
jgi:hypothetical protein